MSSKEQSHHPAIDSTHPLLWIEVDETALKANIRAVRAVIGASTKIMAVVKADGYGHGGQTAARAFLAGGADSLAVTTLDEALLVNDVRKGPAAVPLLVFAPMIDEAQAVRAIVEEITVTVCDVKELELIANAAQSVAKTAHVHLKIDTGMGRFGLAPDLAFGVAQKIAESPNVELDGVYTHFGQAIEPDLSPTRVARGKFTTFCNRLSGAGIDFGLRHCANSAAALRLPESRMDMVRLGTVLYGQYPSPNVPRVDGLNCNTWSMKARAVFVHDLEAGETVGYGAQYRAPAKRRVAVLPVGFGDGFATTPISRYTGMAGIRAVLAGMLGQSQPYVTFNGHRAPVLGRVAMQTVVVDVTDIAPPVAAGSVADIPIRRLAARSSIPRILKSMAS